MKKILITGAAGLVGSTLIKKIIKDKSLMIAIDDLSCGKLKFIQPFFKRNKFKFFKRDISTDKLEILLKKNIKNIKFNEIWLLAANSDIQKGIKNPKIDFKNTYLTTFNFLNNIEKNLAKDAKIIFTSSSAVYGQNINNKVLSEGMGPYEPVSNYGAMKLASEAYITHFSHKNKINYHIYRLPNIIGENITHGIFYDMKKKFLNKKNTVKILGNGNQKKPYMYVDNLIEIMTKNHHKKSLIINVGQDDSGITVKSIINLFAKYLKSKKILEYGNASVGWLGDVPKYSLTNKKVNELKLYPKLLLSSYESAKKTIIKIL